MKPAEILQHKAPLTAALVALVLLALVLLRPAATPPRAVAAQAPAAPAQRDAAEDERNRQPVDEYRRTAGAVPPLTSPRESAVRPAPAAAPAGPAGPRVVASPPELPMTIALFDDPAPPLPPTTGGPGPTAAAAARVASHPRGPVRPVSARFLAFGEPVKCALVFAVASDSSETPVVGLVTEDRYFDGRLVIPRGTKVHGTVGGLTGPSRARKLRTGQRWTLVFPQFEEVANGAELSIRATALHRAETGRGAWAVSDGDGGLRGVTLYDPTPDRIREFATAFLASAASGLQSTVSTATREGTVREVENTPRNAALGGVSAVLSSEVARIQDEIRSNGAYVFVPSGTTFYLYPLQTVDLAEARRGDSSSARAEPPPTPELPALENARAEPVPVPSAYGRGPYDLTRQAVDAAVNRLRPNPR